MVIKKRGFFFTIDAILAASIIILAIIAASSYYVKETKTETVDFLSQDLVGAFTNLKVNEIDNNYTKKLIQENNITRLNNTLLEQLGEFWSENDLEHATKFASNITQDLIPQKFGIGIWINDELIYTRNKTLTKTLVSSRKLISGIAKEKPIYGISSRAFLKSIDSKKAYAFVYFGGFVGQGNITKQLDYIPSDAKINSSFIEFDAGSEFQLYINEQYCNSFTPTGENMTSTSWEISYCNNNFLAGVKNNISIKFPGRINESFIAGGYVKVKYITQEMIRNETPGIDYYYFPGIEGLINLYSSFDIPGTLRSIDLYVHFYNNRTTFLKIGNQTVFTSYGSSEDQIINLSGLTLPLEPETIPIRLATGNITGIINITSGEPSDSVLVTDVSGSMDDCGLTGLDDFCSYDCYWWLINLGNRECLYEGSCSGDQCNTGCSGGSYSTTNHQVSTKSGCLKTKLEMAKEAGLDFVNVILSNIGHQIGLVSYSTDVDSTEDLTDVKVNLENEINSYSDNGYTCICCGINRAKDMLLADNDRRFMIVMSDGQENRYCSNYFDYTGSSSSSIDSILAGENACDNNITVFAVGFGSDADHDTLKQVACNDTLYYNATNTSKLSEIYQKIGDDILIIANYSSQLINIEGAFNKSILYPDSYIKFNYTPVVSPPSFGEIEIDIETDKFDDCSPIVDIPDDLRVTEARVLSYSGKHWTSFLSSNNNIIFNISKYGTDYQDLGDPFVVQVPPNFLQNGNNQLIVQTADDPSNFTGCSKNNSMIYTGSIKSSVDYGNPLTNASGCTWTIELEDGGTTNLKAPSTYSGSEECNYSSSDIIYNQNDAYDVSVLTILQQLDFNDNGKIDVDFDENDLVIDYVVVRDVPSLWGPAVIEIRVWE